MTQARQELGSEAMLMNSQRTGAQAAHLGRYEVVFAYADGGAAAASSTQETPAPDNRLAAEVADLKRQMERIATTLARSTAALARPGVQPDAAMALAQVNEAELDAALANELVLAAREAEQDFPDLNINELVARALRARVAVDTAMPGAGGVVALVGPPGAGKTSTLVKLAIHHGLMTRTPCHFVTTDTLRIAAADQLRAFAAILGIGFEVAETPAGFENSLQANRNKLVFVDTPGLSTADTTEMEDLRRTLEGRATVHLVLSAAVRLSDMARIAEQFENLHPAKLIFTRLDETRKFGPMLSLAAQQERPVSFLSRGQRIPDDLEPADADALTRLVLNADDFATCGMAIAAA